VSTVVKSMFVSLGAVLPPVGPCDEGGDCSQPVMVPSTVMADGVLAGTWSVRIEDAVTDAVVCDDHGLEVACLIPARLQREPPHPYRVAIDLAGETSLSVGAGTMGEFTLLTLNSTGLAPVTDGYYHCDHPHADPSGNLYCTAATQWAHVVALDRASVQFSPIDVALTTTPDTGAGIVPPYLAPDALTFAARVWDAGDEGL
jgi:hypothetical protein